MFIHWEAADDKKIYDYNYEAVKLSIARALNGEPSVDKVLADTPDARAPVRRRRRGVASKPLTAQAGELPLAGLRAVVTGASSGIGRAIAVAFAAAGARVGIGFWRSADAAQALAAELGGDHPLLQADLDRDGCAAFVDEAFDALEHVDVWVNNAGADVLTGEAAGVAGRAQARGAARRRPEGHDPLLAAGRRPHAARRLHPQHGLGPRHDRRAWRATTPSCSPP